MENQCSIVLKIYTDIRYFFSYFTAAPSGRIVHKMALEEDPQNFLLMHSIGVNVSGQIASVIAGGIILNIAAKLMGG